MKKAQGLDEKAYFTDVAHLKYEITAMMQKHHLIREMVLNNAAEEITPFYGRIASDGAFGLEFSLGVPKIIYTPYGGVEIESAKNCRGTFDDHYAFMLDMVRTFGLVEAQPYVRNNYLREGPRCAVTKLPWKTNEVFPSAFREEKISGDKCFNIYGSKQEKAHVAAIYQAVNDALIKGGHADYVSILPKPKPKLVLDDETTKKRTFVAQLKQFLKIKDHGKEL